MINYTELQMKHGAGMGWVLGSVRACGWMGYDKIPLKQM